jgi:lactoylglutathione lyase
MGTRIDMIGIFVKDLKRMVMFYKDVLGFETSWDGNGPYAEFKHAGVRFSMMADREYDRIIKVGAKSVYAPRDEPWGMHSSMIADPEGNMIEIGSWNKGEAEEGKSSNE